MYINNKENSKTKFDSYSFGVQNKKNSIQFQFIIKKNKFLYTLSS